MLRGTNLLFSQDGSNMIPRFILNGASSLLNEGCHRYNRRIPNYQQIYYCYSNTTRLNKSDIYKEKGIENDHRLFKEQLLELEEERASLFGNDMEVKRDADPIRTTGTNTLRESDLQREDRLNQMKVRRELLYDFTEEEKDSWVNITNKPMTPSASLMKEIEKARNERKFSESKDAYEEDQKNDCLDIGNIKTQVYDKHFTHLNPTGDKIAMVDVGTKEVTKRVAKAQSVVIFPPEVMEAFGLKGHEEPNKGNLHNDEVIGPKGPIFATAELAGIMGAKRTSDLIPLCHPLTLDNVVVNIKLVQNRAIIECECRVTHKTGVEMEALVGASVAALTIYDMVKAISHNVRIEETVLLSKSGGKRDLNDSNV